MVKKEEFNSVTFSKLTVVLIICYVSCLTFLLRHMICIITVNSVGHSMLWHLCCFRSPSSAFFFCLLLARKISPFLQNLYFISNKKKTFLLC